jgi:hypothetical protein
LFVRGRIRFGAGDGIAGLSLSLTLLVPLVSFVPATFLSVTFLFLLPTCFPLGDRRSPSSASSAGFAAAIPTAPPVHHLGLVDLEAAVVIRGETRGGADSAVDVDHAAALATDQVVVVVADAILETRRRSGGLNTPDEAFADQNAERVVHRLKRDGPDVGPDNRGHGVGGGMGLTRHGPQDSESLGRDLNPALTKTLGLIGGQGRQVISDFGLIQMFDRYPNSPSAIATPLARQPRDAGAEENERCGQP